MSSNGNMDADALAARLAEIDALRDRGVLDDQEHAVARAAALESALSAPTEVPSSSPKASPKGSAAAPETADRSRTRTWAIGGAAAALAVVAIVVGVILATRGSDTPAPTPTLVPATKTTSPAAIAAAFPRYAGSTFSIRYPRGWQRETTNQDLGGYYDTTWVSPALGKDTILRVNHSPGEPADGFESVNQLEAGTAQTPGYQRVSLTSTMLGGMPAARWEFLTTGDSGHTLRTVNILATDGTDGWAVLTRNPVSKHAEWAPKFRTIRKSFRIG